MKKALLFTSFLIFSLGSFAQTNVNLKLHHYYNNDVFNYGDPYIDAFGNVIEITRVQYYLTGFDLVHDSGTNTSLGDTVILASGNITDYVLCNTNITTLEAINFDLGVDAGRNHLDPNSYDVTHPLSPQNPNMHWGWTAGYKFLVIEGMADTNNDSIVDTGFQFHVTGDDSYLQNVLEINVVSSASGSSLDIDVDVNIADWLKGVDCATAGVNHGAFPINASIMSNTNPYTVFSADIGLGMEDNAAKDQSNVYFDYSMPYAPTIFYKFPTAESVSITITDMNGRIILTENNLPKAANYFIETELTSGTYIAIFRTNTEAVRSEKFVVNN